MVRDLNLGSRSRGPLLTQHFLVIKKVHSPTHVPPVRHSGPYVVVTVLPAGLVREAFRRSSDEAAVAAKLVKRPDMTFKPIMLLPLVGTTILVPCWSYIVCFIF